MKTIRMFSPYVISTLLLLPGCGVNQVPPEPMADAETEGDGDGDGESGDGDGDPKPQTTAMFVPLDVLDDQPTCDPWAQDCPDGEKCVAYSADGGNWDSNHCVMVSGEGVIGDPCTYSGTIDSIDNCGADSFCWNVNEDGNGVCTPFCDGSPDDPICGPDQGCTIANEGSINLCLTTCDPLLQNCEEGSVCFYDFSGDFVCNFAADMVLTGGVCGFINDCAPGNVCLSAEALPSCEAGTCCGAFCSIADPACETPGTECTPFFEEGTAPPMYVDVGVCIVPGA